MRLVRYRDGQSERFGALVTHRGEDRLLDLTTKVPGQPASITELLSDPAALEAAHVASRWAQREPSSLPLTSSVELLAPVRPGKILCLGYNYRGHVPDGQDPTANDPEHPDVFVKTPNTLSGPDDVVTLPPVATDVDYEGEIAVVIGRRAHAVSVEAAMDHVAGYTLFDDVSDRSWQRRSSQWTLGKCFDGFGQLGPAIVTSDEVLDFHDLTVEVIRDSAVTVSQSTDTMVFRLPFLIHYLSHVMTLEPGDVISTGTPQKLPDALTAHRPLGHGDAVTIRVAGLGELTTRFADPTARDDSLDQGVHA